MAKNMCTERLEDVELMTQLNAQRAMNRELTEKIEAMGKVGIALTAQIEQERAKRKKEISGLTVFVGVGAALCVAGACWLAALCIAGACWLAAPWWTAVAPLVLMVSVMRNAGWM